MRCYEWLCHSCKKYIDRYMTSIDEHRDQILTCPECGGDMKYHPSFMLNQGDCAYPRYDRGLGMILKNEAHRREVCKERGLIPADGGDIDVSSIKTSTDHIEDYEKTIQRLDREHANSDAYVQANRKYRTAMGMELTI